MLSCRCLKHQLTIAELVSLAAISSLALVGFANNCRQCGVKLTVIAVWGASCKMKSMYYGYWFIVIMRLHFSINLYHTFTVSTVESIASITLVGRADSGLGRGVICALFAFGGAGLASTIAITDVCLGSIPWLAGCAGRYTIGLGARHTVAWASWKLRLY